MMNVPVLRVLTEVLAKMVKGRLAAHVLQPTKDVHVKVSFTFVAWADVVSVCPISTNCCGFQKCSCFHFPKIFARKEIRQKIHRFSTVCVIQTLSSL